jgi:hypothetical protein
MTHLADDDMVLHYYDEAGTTAEVADHLATCAECREQYAVLERTLGAISASPVPERDESYGRVVWARLRPQIEAIGVPTRSKWLPWRLALWPRFALAGALAVLVIGAFLAGRAWQRVPPPAAPGVAEVALQGQDRILMVAVAQHLERSARMLVELTNQPMGATIDISTEQSRASDLIAAGRLYRQAALRAGEGGLANVLEDIERVFSEITNSPSSVSRADMNLIRQRLEDTGLLFKVRVAESHVRQRQVEQTRPAGPRLSQTKVG